MRSTSRTGVIILMGGAECYWSDYWDSHSCSGLFYAKESCPRLNNGSRQGIKNYYCFPVIWFKNQTNSTDQEAAPFGLVIVNLQLFVVTVQ